MDSAALPGGAASGGLSLTPLLLFLVGAVAAGLFIWTWKRGWRPFRGAQEFEIDEAVLGIGSQKVKLRANRDDLRVAVRARSKGLESRTMALRIISSFTGDVGELLRLARCPETLVQGADDGIPAFGGTDGHVEHAAHVRAATLDAACAAVRELPAGILRPKFNTSDTYKG